MKIVKIYYFFCDFDLQLNFLFRLIWWKEWKRSWLIFYHKETLNMCVTQLYRHCSWCGIKLGLGNKQNAVTLLINKKITLALKWSTHIVCCRVSWRRRRRDRSRWGTGYDWVSSSPRDKGPRSLRTGWMDGHLQI